MARTTFSGPVASTAGFEGDITGDVTGNIDSPSGNFDELVVTGNVDMQGTGNIIVLPTSDPGVANAVWINAGNIDISAG